MVPRYEPLNSVNAGTTRACSLSLKGLIRDMSCSHSPGMSYNLAENIRDHGRRFQPESCFILTFCVGPDPAFMPGESGIYEVRARNTPDTSADGMAALLLMPQFKHCG